MGPDENTTKDKATTNMNAAELKEKSFISIKDQLVEKARSFNLLSNVFMSVALNDNPVCQHVLHNVPQYILTGPKAKRLYSRCLLNPSSWVIPT